MTTYRLKAVNSDHDTCSVCGKTDLKKVMWLSELGNDNNDFLDPFPAGTTCGARLLGVSTSGGAKRTSIRVKELAYKQISDYVWSIKTNRELFWLYKRTYLPKDCVIQMRIGEMTMAEALKIRDERYPIMTY